MKRHYRLRLNQDFQRLRRHGQSVKNAHLVLTFMPNRLDHSRFGFVVSKRMGKAVQRNKIKRRLREIVRLRLATIKSGFDIVVITRHPSRTASYEKLAQRMDHLLRKADLLIPDPEARNTDL